MVLWLSFIFIYYNSGHNALKSYSCNIQKHLHIWNAVLTCLYFLHWKIIRSISLFFQRKMFPHPESHNTTMRVHWGTVVVCTMLEGILWGQDMSLILSFLNKRVEPNGSCKSSSIPPSSLFPISISNPLPSPGNFTSKIFTKLSTPFLSTAISSKLLTILVWATAVASSVVRLQLLLSAFKSVFQLFSELPIGNEI